MIIDLISDLHGYYPKLEGGDLLIVAGDLTARDEPEQYAEFYEWILNQQYTKKIIVAGNHDNFIQSIPDFFKILSSDLIYLCDSRGEFEGLKIWGSPWTKTFPRMNPHCKAFTVDTEEELAIKFSLIPEDTDILITHSPPYGIFDETEHGECVGSTELLKRTLKIRPRIHLFGHIHEQGGKFGGVNLTQFINCSHVNERYQPVNKPVRVEL